MEVDGFKLCGEVDGHEFIRRMVEDDFSASSTRSLRSLRGTYHHALSCEHCAGSVTSAFQEYRTGNKKFDVEKVRRNMRYIKDVQI